MSQNSSQKVSRLVGTLEPDSQVKNAIGPKGKKRITEL